MMQFQQEKATRACCVVERRMSVVESKDIIERALRQAGISPGRCGTARGSELTDQERSLYRWILQFFAGGRRPSIEALDERAAPLGLDGNELLTRLESLDLIQRDSQSGEITVAYPFAGYPTAHEVWLDHNQPVYAMCAIDALGVPFMLGRTTTVISHDPITGERVRVEVDPGGASRYAPSTAVVVAGASATSGSAATRCCQVINFFESAESAERYVQEHPSVHASLLAIPEALQMGEFIFGRVLEE